MLQVFIGCGYSWKTIQVDGREEEIVEIDNKVHYPMLTLLNFLVGFALILMTLCNYKHSSILTVQIGGVSCALCPVSCALLTSWLGRSPASRQKDCILSQLNEQTHKGSELLISAHYTQ